MAEKIFLEVSVKGNELRSVSSLNLVQTIFDHHTFEVVVPSESIAAKNEDLFNALAELIGEKILIDWEIGTSKGKGGSNVSSFKGFIFDAAVSGHSKDHLFVTLSGKSPTALMDAAPNAETYAQVGLKELYDKANSSNLTSEIKAEDNLTFKGKIPFVVQYGETDFDFICRMMHEHGEWFYYDGQKICLGLANSPALTLGPQRVHSLDFTFSAVPPAPTLSAWDYLADEQVDVQGAKPDHADSTAAKVQKRSDDLLYPAGSDKEVLLPHPSYAEGEDHQPKKADLKSAMDRLRQGWANNTHRVVGSSDLAEIKVGTTLKIDGHAYGGEYIVTHVNHTCRGKDGYLNHFQAVPAGSVIPASIRTAVPRIESTRGKVTANKDPEKLGRVRVAFAWGSAETPWLRILWPHAGKDRGFYFVPEVGDEVLVGFEMGKERSPYVIGSFYNGKNAQKSQFTEKDEIKIIRTRSGNEIIFDDRGLITVRNEKNSIELNCDANGSVTLKTKGDLIFSAEQDVKLEAGGSVLMKSGKEFSIDAGKDVKVAARANVDIAASAGAKINANSTLEVSATGQLTLKGATSKLNGSALTEVSGALVKIN